MWIIFTEATSSNTKEAEEAQTAPAGWTQPCERSEGARAHNGTGNTVLQEGAKPPWGEELAQGHAKQVLMAQSPPAQHGASFTQVFNLN